MNGTLEIYKKELARIFRDKKMIFSVFLLPVLIMILILGIINNLTGSMEEDIESHVPIVYIEGQPSTFESFLEAGDLNYTIKDVASEADRAKAEDDILNGEADLLIEFPEGFEEDVLNYSDGDEVPQVKTYYNPSEDYSNQAFQSISAGVLESYRQTLLTGRMGSLEQIQVFTVNSDNPDMEIQDDSKASGKALGMMLPYFITILLFAGAMGIGADMIAGEKERGTMASLLVAPVKRTSIVLGKVFALMTLSGISAAIYIGAMAVASPVFMNYMTGMSEMDLNLSAEQIIMLGALLISLAFFYSAIVAIVSVFARTTKEANSYIMPAYMVVLVVGLLTMFRIGEGSSVDYYIPLYNSALALQGILSQEVTVTQYIITLAETLALGGLLTVLTTYAFKNEKLMAL